MAAHRRHLFSIKRLWALHLACAVLIVLAISSRLFCLLFRAHAWAVVLNDGAVVICAGWCPDGWAGFDVSDRYGFFFRLYDVNGVLSLVDCLLMGLFFDWDLPRAVRTLLGAGTYTITIPLWPLVGLVILVTYIGRRWLLPRSGCCIQCGYDLRGSSGDRCPECGVRHSRRPDELRARDGPRRILGVAGWIMTLAYVPLIRLVFYLPIDWQGVGACVALIVAAAGIALIVTERRRSRFRFDDRGFFS